MKCYRSTGLGIGQGMVVIGEVIATSCGYGLKLVVRQAGTEIYGCSTKDVWRAIQEGVLSQSHEDDGV